MRPTPFALVLAALLVVPAFADGKDPKHKGGDHKPAPAQKPPEAPKKTEPPKKEEHAKPAEAKPLALGAEADASLSLTDVQGKPQSLKDCRGKVTVVEFWSLDAATAPWEAKTAKLIESCKKKSVSFLLVDAAKGDIDAGDKPYKRIEEHAQKAGLACPILIDKSEQWAERFGATATGEVFVLDAKGVLQYRGAIDDDPKGEKGDKAVPLTANALEAVLAGKAPSPNSSPVTGAPIHVSSKPAEAGGKAPAPAPAPKK